MSTLPGVLEKLKGWDALRILPLLEAFPGEGEGAESVLRGENRIILEKIIRKLFDRTGRCIPAHLGVTSKICDENRKLHVNLSEIGYGKLHQIITGYFPKEMEFVKPVRFVHEAEALKKRYANHELVGNFFKRARPILLPRFDARENMGASLERIFVPAVERAYKMAFPGRKFVNYKKNHLSGNVSIVPNTGHEELVAMMAEKSFAAWYSPNPFQGFSINAQHEAMKILMQYGFALAGGIDTAVAAVAYVGEMARDFKTSNHTCSALSHPFSFSAYSSVFGFDSIKNIDDAFDSCSGGLVLFR